jgi:hypothetical protein
MKFRVPSSALHKGDLFTESTQGDELGEIGCVVASSIQDMTARFILGSNLELFCIRVSVQVV